MKVKTCWKRMKIYEDRNMKDLTWKLKILLNQGITTQLIMMKNIWKSNSTQTMIFLFKKMLALHGMMIVVEW